MKVLVIDNNLARSQSLLLILKELEVTSDSICNVNGQRTIGGRWETIKESSLKLVDPYQVLFIHTSNLYADIFIQNLLKIRTDLYVISFSGAGDRFEVNDVRYYGCPNYVSRWNKRLVMDIFCCLKLSVK